MPAIVTSFYDNQMKGGNLHDFFVCCDVVIGTMTIMLLHDIQVTHLIFYPLIIKHEALRTHFVSYLKAWKTLKSIVPLTLINMCCINL